MSLASPQSWLPRILSPQPMQYLPLSQQPPLYSPPSSPAPPSKRDFGFPPPRRHLALLIVLGACSILYASFTPHRILPLRTRPPPWRSEQPSDAGVDASSSTTTDSGSDRAAHRLEELSRGYDGSKEGFGKGSVDLGAYREEVFEAYSRLLGDEDGALDLLSPEKAVRPLRPDLACHLSLSCNTTSPVPDHLYFTDRIIDPAPPSVPKWLELNPDAEAHLLSDNQVAAWITSRFPNGAIPALYNSLPDSIPILKFDLFRLLVLLRGGVYSDTDTIPIKAFRDWSANVVALTEEDGVLVDEEVLSQEPSLIVGLEWVGREENEKHPLFSRNVGFVQWTFGSAPGHPVLVDSIRQIAENVKNVEEYWANNATSDVLHFDPESARMVLEMTGPAVLTDAVTRYLRTRWGASTSAYAHSAVPIRIGDVVILPVAALNARLSLGMKLLDWALGRNPNGRSDEQDCVVHEHAASWWSQRMRLDAQKRP